MELKIATVAELQERMSGQEFDHWRAYSFIKPFGHWRGDVQAGMICKTFAEVMTGEAHTIDQFIPTFTAPKERIATEPEMSDREIKTFFLAFFGGNKK